MNIFEFKEFKNVTFFDVHYQRRILGFIAHQSKEN